MDFRKLKGVGEIACVNGGPDYYKNPITHKCLYQKKYTKKVNLLLSL